MISSNSELYDAVRALIEDLRQRGEMQWAANLADAMAISGHAGEILGQLRLELRRLQQSDMKTELGPESRINDALGYLDRVLGPLPSDWH